MSFPFIPFIPLIPLIPLIPYSNDVSNGDDDGDPKRNGMVVVLIVSSIFYGLAAVYTACFIAPDICSLVDELFDGRNLPFWVDCLLSAAAKIIFTILAAALWPVTGITACIAWAASSTRRHRPRNRASNAQELQVIPERNEQQQSGQATQKPRRENKIGYVTNLEPQPPVYRP